MSETLFISDLHLGSGSPARLELFLGFLAGRAPQAERLFILGDLFDAWIGDDHQAPPIPMILEALRRLSEQGTEIWLMHGNRDFLLGEDFCRAAGCRLLPDPYPLDLYGTPSLLMHGDLLCTDDQAYLHFRQQVRSPPFVAAFLAKPIPERLAIAQEYRRMSGEANSLKAADIMDVNQEAVEQQMRRHGVSLLIHGHTHRPARHDFWLDGQAVTRLVLADWSDDQGAVLRVTPEGIGVEPIGAGETGASFPGCG